MPTNVFTLAHFYENLFLNGDHIIYKQIQRNLFPEKYQSLSDEQIVCGFFEKYQRILLQFGRSTNIYTYETYMRTKLLRQFCWSQQLGNVRLLIRAFSSLLFAILIISGGPAYFCCYTASYERILVAFINTAMARLFTMPYFSFCPLNFFDAH